MVDLKQIFEGLNKFLETIFSNTFTAIYRIHGVLLLLLMSIGHELLVPYFLDSDDVVFQQPMRYVVFVCLQIEDIQ